MKEESGQSTRLSDVEADEMRFIDASQDPAPSSLLASDPQSQVSDLSQSSSSTYGTSSTESGEAPMTAQPTPPGSDPSDGSKSKPGSTPSRRSGQKSPSGFTTPMRMTRSSRLMEQLVEQQLAMGVYDPEKISRAMQRVRTSPRGSSMASDEEGSESGDESRDEDEDDSNATPSRSGGKRKKLLSPIQKRAMFIWRDKNKLMNSISLSNVFWVPSPKLVELEQFNAQWLESALGSVHMSSSGHALMPMESADNVRMDNGSTNAACSAQQRQDVLTDAANPVLKKIKTEVETPESKLFEPQMASPTGSIKIEDVSIKTEQHHETQKLSLPVRSPFPSPPEPLPVSLQLGLEFDHQFPEATLDKATDGAIVAGGHGRERLKHCPEIDVAGDEPDHYEKLKRSRPSFFIPHAPLEWPDAPLLELRARALKEFGVPDVDDREFSKEEPCSCSAKDPAPCSDSTCELRRIFVECDRMCPAGRRCQNRRIQKKQYCKTRLVRTENRGWGLILAENVGPGQLVAEYCGEIVDKEESRRRMILAHRISDPNFYFFQLSANAVLDAGPAGSLARFINHSCDPNCETQKWSVNGETRVGIFTKTALSKGVELTYNYFFSSDPEMASEHKVVCLCGSANCPGFMGQRPLKVDAPASSSASTTNSTISSDDSKTTKDSAPAKGAKAAKGAKGTNGTKGTKGTKGAKSGQMTDSAPEDIGSGKAKGTGKGTGKRGGKKGSAGKSDKSASDDVPTTKTKGTGVRRQRKAEKADEPQSTGKQKRGAKVSRHVNEDSPKGKGGKNKASKSEPASSALSVGKDQEPKPKRKYVRKVQGNPSSSSPSSQ